MTRFRLIQFFIMLYYFLIIILFIIFKAVDTLHDTVLPESQNRVGAADETKMRYFSPQIVQPSNTKYILQWTTFVRNEEYFYIDVGRRTFIERNCPFTNCYVTADRSFFEDVTKFDAVLFVGQDVFYMPELVLPAKRAPHQKYVFAAIEFDMIYPLCSNQLDGLFNWTWSYKLDSDARWGNLVVRNDMNEVIGPNINMHWIKKEEMLPVTAEIKEIISGKSRAVAWISSECFSMNNHRKFARNLEYQLLKYNLSLDVYGACGHLICPNGTEDACSKMLQKEYYFYLSFESLDSEDYVTNTLLTAVLNNVVPIVYGGANYSRFLPEGSYLNALSLGAKRLAAKINKSIHNLDLYSEFFRWIPHYSYEPRGLYTETDDYCGFCELLNNEDKVKETKIYENFSKWWDSYRSCSHLLRNATSNLNDTKLNASEASL